MGARILKDKRYWLILGAFLLITAIASLAIAASKSTSKEMDEGLIYVYSQTCGYCKEFTPSFEQAVSSYPELKVERWDIYSDEEKRNKAIEMGTEATPTVFLVKEGKVVDKLVGSVGEQAVRKFIDKNLQF